ncbi:DUF4231 domain-containing protein [Actinophytocola glycyrrhizae]|uniref:DUF4231 domain-containing protein n=1 Tax=Actinophytocola glycyrrhizae TaxID=2044873 RepID=A0ABV9RZ68_9PSEU
MINSDVAITLLWQRQSVWSQAANRLKVRITWARSATLLLIVLGAVFGTGAAQAQGTLSRVLAAGAAVALALASLAGRGGSPTVVRDWTRARSVSEAIKADVYTYLAGARPFDGPDRDEKALHELDDLMRSVDDIVRHTTGLTPVDRSLPPVHDVDSYAKERVVKQLDGYYLPKAREMARKVQFTHVLEVTLSGAAAVLAAVVAVLPSTAVSAWIGVFTTVAAAVTAHAAASRYEYQQIEFTRTADELERLTTLRAVGGHLDDEEFVVTCERIISIQNEGWMARLGTNDTEDSSSA